MAVESMVISLNGVCQVKCVSSFFTPLYAV